MLGPFFKLFLPVWRFKFNSLWMASAWGYIFDILYKHTVYYYNRNTSPAGVRDVHGVHNDGLLRVRHPAPQEVHTGARAFLGRDISHGSHGCVRLLHAGQVGQVSFILF